MDVNIHPTKTEIKFEDDNVIFQTLFACIRQALGRNSFDSIDFDNGGADLPVIGKNFDEFRPVSGIPANTDPTFNPFDNDGFPSEQSPYTNSFGDFPAAGSVSSGQHGDPGDVFAAGGWEEHTSRFIEKRDDYGKLFEDKLAPARSVLTVQGKYIVTSARSGLMVINIRRAMERIMYDRFLDALSKNEHATQTALFPVSVYVGVENMYLFEQHSQMLVSLGFDIVPFGNDTVVVNGVPEGYSVEADKVQSMIGDLLLVLSEDHGSLPQVMTANMAARLARLGAFNAEIVADPAEAQRLIDTLFACENAEYTSSGKRIISIVPVEEIDKRF